MSDIRPISEKDTVATLRKVAKGIIPNFGKLSKVDLVAAILAWNAAQAPAPKAPKAPKASKRCANGCGRPAHRSTPEGELCLLCEEHFGHENTHSDYAHDSIADMLAKGIELDQRDAAENLNRANCWICHPELDKSIKPAGQRIGSSRAGMKINVPMRASGQEKADFTAARIASLGPVVSVDSKRGIVTLTCSPRSGASRLILTWDLAGHCQGGTFDGKRILNVAAGLRKLGAIQ